MLAWLQSAGAIAALIRLSLSTVWVQPPLPALEWPMYQYRENHNAVFGSPDWSVAWRASIGAKTNGGLSVVGTTLYATSFDHNVYAIDAPSGRVLWKTDVGNITMTTPVVWDGLVFAGTGTSKVLKDNHFELLWGRPEGDAMVALQAASGALAWRFDTVGEDMPSPIIAHAPTGDSLIFVSGDRHIRAVNPFSGKLRWMQSLIGVPSMSSLNRLGSSILGIENFGFDYIGRTESNDVLYKQRSRTFAFRADDGQYAWTSFYGNSDCSPTVDNGIVFISSDQRLHSIHENDTTSYNLVYALDGQTGSLLWKYASGTGRWTTVGSKEEAIAGVADGGMFFDALPFPQLFVAFEERTGRVLWSLKTRAPVKMSALARDNRLYVGDTGGSFYVLDERTGAVLKTLRFPGGFTASPPVIVGRTLFVANGSFVYAVPIDRLEQGTIDSLSPGTSGTF